MQLLRTLLAFLIFTIPICAFPYGKRPQYEVVGYVFGHGERLNINSVAAEKMTRINYAFLALKDGTITERNEHDAENLSALAALRKANPQLQILVSVGGGGVGSAGFSDMAITAEGRRRFVDSAIAIVEKYSLDGIDVDWEYPGYTHVKTTTVRPEDRNTYTLLLRDLRRRFDHEQNRLGRSLVTSSATGATEIWLDHTNMRAASKWLTTVNMMCYDWYSNSEKNTGHDSPLHTVASDPKQISIDDAVKRNLAAGVPAKKLVIGVPFYGRRWEGVDGANHGLWQPIMGRGREMPYGEIEPLINQQGYERFWDNRAATPYLYNEQNRTFITYNDAAAEKERTVYVMRNHLGGIMFWQYAGDPHNTLLDAIDRSLGFTAR